MLKRVRKEDNATAVDIEMGDGDSIVPSTMGFEEETTQQPVESQSLLAIESTERQLGWDGMGEEGKK